MVAELRVLTWNLNAFTTDRTGEKLDLLERVEWDVACLQELLPRSLDAVRDRFGANRVVACEPADGWPRPAARHRCAVVLRQPDCRIDPRNIDCSDGIDGPTPKDREAPRELLVGADVRVSELG